MLFFLDYSHANKNMWRPMCKAIWRLPLPWSSIWRSAVVETGPRQGGKEKDPKGLKIKSRKKVMWRKLRGARLGGLSRRSRS